MADGAAAAAAPPRADALKAPPRYSLANAAWPDDQLTRLLPTARGADPALANLLRDPAQAAEAHKIVSELTDDAEALGRLRALRVEVDVGLAVSLGCRAPGRIERAQERLGASALCR